MYTSALGWESAQEERSPHLALRSIAGPGPKTKYAARDGHRVTGAACETLALGQANREIGIKGRKEMKITSKIVVFVFACDGKSD